MTPRNIQQMRFSTKSSRAYNSNNFI